MRRAKLRRKVRQQARREFRRGAMTQDQFKSAMAVAASNEALDELQQRIDEAGLDPWKNPDRLIGADWRSFFSNLWDWFVENWPAILALIMKIAPLLLLEPKHEDS